MPLDHRDTPILEPGVGVVQARWGHLNRDTGWFTRLLGGGKTKIIEIHKGHLEIEKPAPKQPGVVRISLPLVHPPEVPSGHGKN